MQHQSNFVLEEKMIEKSVTVNEKAMASLAKLFFSDDVRFERNIF